MQFSSNAVDELLFGVSSVIQSAVIAAAVHYMNRRESRRQRSIRITFPRQRTSVVEVYNSMGPRIFRRAFRMTFDAFWRLHSILLPHLRTAISDNSNYVRKGGREGGNYSLPPIRNGPISPSIRLGATIRYFAFGVSYSEVLTSVWIVVDAINKFAQFEIAYPDTMEE
jgi:hypothetical protein